MPDIKPEAYWEKAGELSYAAAMFADFELERHVNARLYQIGIDIGIKLGLNSQSHILDLGCGDGALANVYLAKHFRAVDGFDLSAAAIKRASELAPNQNMRFECCDITKMDFGKLPRYDGAFLWGILHHVKSAAPHILGEMRKAGIKRIVILEPNGNHLARKLLEFTATYKAAGEDSFRTKQMEKIFSEAGYSPLIGKRLNLFPNFTPRFIFESFKHIEPIIEKTPLLRALCTVNLWGFIADD